MDEYFASARENIVVIPQCAALVLPNGTFLENTLRSMEKQVEKEIGTGEALRNDCFTEKATILSCLQTSLQATERPEPGSAVAQRV